MNGNPVSGDKSVYMINDDSQFSGIIEQTLENGHLGK